MRNTFTRFAKAASDALGTPLAFVVALASCALWAIAGPFTGYSDSWMLVINTGTTIVTFLMAFILLNAQNRDSKAIHLKLDELINAQQDARNSLIDLENASEQQIDAVAREFQSDRT